MASLLTGLLPSQHGNVTQTQPPRLLDAVTTYAEVLRETHGYETGAYASGPWINMSSSLLQGFTHGAHAYALEGTHKILAGFVRKRDKAKPFFSSKGPTTRHARGLIFFYQDPETKRIRLHSIRDFLE